MRSQNFKKKYIILKFLSIIVLGYISTQAVRLYNHNHDMYKLLKKHNTSLDFFFCRPYSNSKNYSGFCNFNATSKQVQIFTSRLKFRRVDLTKSPEEILSKNIDMRKSSEDELQELRQALLISQLKKEQCWDHLNREEKSKVDIYYPTTRTISFRNQGEMELSGYYYKMYISYSESTKKGCIMYLYPGFVGNE
jgi:hypothetical protein